MSTVLYSKVMSVGKIILAALAILALVACSGVGTVPTGTFSSSLEAEGVDKRACIYTGSGAELARDVEVALDKLNIPYSEVNEHTIREGGLGNCPLLIVPGGYTARCVAALGGRGFERIREFVAGGGGYVGICAGAYIAPQVVEVPGRPPGLGIIEIRNERRAGSGIKRIGIAKPQHAVMEGCEREVEIWYQNGPMIKAGKGVETLAVYEEGSAAIVCATYGEGKVVIFSPHPEGSLAGGADPERLGTLKLLENAIAFASKAGR